MNKRVMILVADGLVFQRGRPLRLPESVSAEDAGHLHIADVSLLIAEEQDNFFQVIALPVPGTSFAAADKSIVVDIPERKADLIVYDAKASECKVWIKKQVDLDRRRAEEDDAEDEDDQEDEHDDQQEDEQQPPPPALVPTPAAVTGGPVPVGPLATLPIAQLAPEPVGQLEVVAPIPLQLPEVKP